MNRLKNLWLLVAAQVACMAVGLWVHYLYVVATVRTEAEEETRSNIAALAQPLVSDLQSVRFDSSPAESAAVIDRVLQSHQPPRAGHFTVTGGDWNVIAERHDGSRELDVLAETGWSQGIWRDAFDLTGKPVRGELNLSDGPHIAVAYSLGGGRGYLLAHQPVAEVSFKLPSILPSLMTAGAITLVWTCGLFAIAVYMIVTHDHDRQSKLRKEPEVEALKRAQALVRTQETIIFGLAKLSDSRDGDTGDHLERISFYCSSLAAALRQHPAYRDQVTPAFVQLIGISSALHDIGKVGVEDAILRKPGLLTKIEYDRMKCHTTIGEECLKEIERRLGTSNFLKMAREIASFHHERWDGKGYPYGLRGEQIPLAARITAIADVYDALSSKRVYKAAYKHEQCVTIIREEAGKHFDPQLVEAFLQVEGTFRDIAKRFGAQEGSIHEVEGEAPMPSSQRIAAEPAVPVVVG